MGRSRAAQAAAAGRDGRFRALHEAALAIAAPVPAEPDAVAALLAQIVAHAVAALGGCDGRIVLAEDVAWRDLVPGTGPTQGHIRLDYTGRLDRMPQRPDGATVHVLTTGEAVSVLDTLEPSRFGVYPRLAQRGVRAFALLPLRVSGQVLGALAVNFDRPGELQGEDQEVLELFAAHAAYALERARLAHAERRQARLDGALLVARTVAHQINNALSPVVGFAELLAVQPAIKSDLMLAWYVRAIGEAAQDVAARVTRLQRIVRLEEDTTLLGVPQPVLDLDRSTAPPPGPAPGPGERPPT